MRETVAGTLPFFAVRLDAISLDAVSRWGGHNLMVATCPEAAGRTAFDQATKLCRDAEQALTFYHIHASCETRESLITSAGSWAATAWSTLDAHLTAAQTRGEHSDLRIWESIMGSLQNLRLHFFRCNNLLSASRAVTADQAQDGSNPTDPQAEGRKGLDNEAFAGGSQSAPAEQPAAAAHPAAAASDSRLNPASQQLPALVRQPQTAWGSDHTPAWRAPDGADRRRKPDPEFAPIHEFLKEPVRRTLKKLGCSELEIMAFLSCLAAVGSAAYELLDDGAMMLIAAEQYPPSRLECSTLLPIECLPPDIEGTYDAATDPNLIMWDPDTHTGPGSSRESISTSACWTDIAASTPPPLHTLRPTATTTGVLQSPACGRPRLLIWTLAFCRSLHWPPSATSSFMRSPRTLTV